MISLNELKTLAEAATPGPWTLAIESGEVFVTDSEYSPIGHAEENASYIAAANPATILTLISALEKYEEALRYMEHRAETGANTQEYWYQVSKGACVSVLSENVTKARETLTQVQKIMEGK